MRLLVLLIYGFFCTVPVMATVIEVCPGCEVQTLQQAIDQANSFDSILLSKGVYKTYNIVVDKPLTITGESGAILDGDYKGEIMTLRSDSILIRGITFRDVGISYTKDWAAISSDKVKHCTIENNTFLNAFFGIYLRKSTDCKIRGNTLIGQAEEEMSSGNAIHLWYCKRMTVINNHVTQHRDGIYFEFVSESRVEQNISEHNIRYGLHFMFSDQDDYIENTFKNNGSGVAVMYSNKIVMRNNEFIENWGPASYGLLLKEIKDGEIIGNNFYKNTSAIFGEGAMRMDISGNRFSYNGWAIKLLSSCMENEIRNNDFVSNSFSVFTNSPRNYNVFEQNYWSSYSGYDMDKDGYGDVPHRPVSLFTYIVDKCEPALLLMRSNFVAVLELAEKAAPSITPETLVDHKPRMRPQW